MIAKTVMADAGIVSDPAYRVIRDVVKREQEHGASADTILGAMVTAWQRLQHERPNLEHSWGAEKFFGEGNWKDVKLWPWKEGKGPKPVRRSMPTNDEMLGR